MKAARHEERVHHLRADEMEIIADDMRALLGNTQRGGDKGFSDLRAGHECDLIRVGVDEPGEVFANAIFVRPET
jgi:hypothetical protein